MATTNYVPHQTRRLRALIYTRVSDDRARGRSPREQEAESRDECDRQDWDVVDVVTDSKGASRHSSGHRSGWETVRRRLAAGDIDVLVTWESSRAQRGLDEYTELRRICVDHGVQWSYKGRLYDLNDGIDRYTTGQDALNDERASEEVSARVLRSTRAQAKQGRPHGRRLYGYRRVYDAGQLVNQVPHYDDAHPAGGEAPVVKRIFVEYLAGHGALPIAKRLTAEGIPTPNRGTVWASSTVRSIIRNPSFAGIRFRLGAMVGPADWEPIVDQDLFDRVQARLAAAKSTPMRQVSAAYLLTGTARCGVCGGRGGGLRRQNGQQAYQCAIRFCVIRVAAKVDAYVVGLLLDRLADPDVIEKLSGASVDPVVELARATSVTLTARLNSAIDAFNRGELTAATLAKSEAALLPQIAAADRTVRDALVPIAIAVPDQPDRQWWDSLDPTIQREVVKAWIVSVVIMPTTQKKRFDPACIRVEFRGN
jgi:DNA invertase Pin-like site-specific DNA recombinase